MRFFPARYRTALLGGAASALVAIIAWAQAPARLPDVEIESFEKVWTIIGDTHWQTRPGGLDWDAIHAEFRPRIDRAKTAEEARAISQEMISRLHQTHFRIQSAADSNANIALDSGIDETSGAIGIDLRVLDGSAVVTSVVPGSPADQAGIHTGWIVQKTGDVELHKLIEKARDPRSKSFASPNAPDVQITRTLEALFRGPVGASREVTFLDGSDRQRTLTLAFTTPRGRVEDLGALASRAISYDEQRLSFAQRGFVEYVSFNFFMVRTMLEFKSSVATCATKDRGQCRALIVDLRGNPGGVTFTSAEMAGSILDQPNQKLGTMYTRESQTDLAVMPAATAFTGPIAILIDANSASTSEIFAGGLQDLHRARVFGTHSAAAALPALIAVLPNGDHFEHAIANYISVGGKPWEGVGVTPEEEVHLTRRGLLAGHDEVIDAALRWIDKQLAAPAQ